MEVEYGHGTDREGYALEGEPKGQGRRKGPSSCLTLEPKIGGGEKRKELDKRAKGYVPKLLRSTRGLEVTGDTEK